MGKLEYLDALKRAMIGLPPETQAKTLAYYEQRFVDGMAAGRSEEDVGRELDDPRKIALTLRTSTHLESFTQKKSPVSFVRLLVAGVGLAVFNLFMVVPAAVYTSLLAALYACALAFYIGGIGVTASGLAGANEFVITGPVHGVTINGGSIEDEQTRVTINDGGIQVHREAPPVPGDPSRPRANSRVIRGAEALNRGIQITSDMDASSRTTQVFVGLGLVLGGIVLTLLALVVTRLTLAGLKRYFQMNISLLRGS